MKLSDYVASPNLSTTQTQPVSTQSTGALSSYIKASGIKPKKSIDIDKRDSSVRKSYADKQAEKLKSTQTPQKLFNALNPTLTPSLTPKVYDPTISAIATQDYNNSPIKRIGLTVKSGLEDVGANQLNSVVNLYKPLGKATIATGGNQRLLNETQKMIDYYQSIANNTSISADKRAAAQKAADGLKQGYQTNVTNFATQTPDQQVNNTTSTVEQNVANLKNTSNTNFAKATLGASNVGKNALEVVKGGVEMGANAAIGAVTGTGVTPFVVDAFGGGAYEAKQSGASNNKQLLYGSAQGALAGLTFGVLGGVSKVLTSTGASVAATDFITKAANKAITKYALSDAGKFALNKLAQMGDTAAQQGAISAIQTAITPEIQRLIYDPNARFNAEDTIHSAIIGAVTGGVLGAVKKSSVPGINDGKDTYETIRTNPLTEYATNSDGTLPKGLTFSETRTFAKGTDKSGNPIFGERPNIPTGKTANGKTVYYDGTQSTPEPTQLSEAVKSPVEQQTTPLADNTLKTQDTAAESKVVNPNDSTGAAPNGFDPYTNMQNKYGNVPEGENPARVVDVPAQTADNNKVSRGVRTALEAQATPESSWAQGLVQDATAQGKFSYLPITDNASKLTAEQTIKTKGWDNAVKDWTADARGGKVSKDAIVLGQTLYNNAMNAGRAKEGIDILVDLVKMSRNGAQATQANRVLKTMSPEYQLYALQRSVQNLSEELTTKFAKKGFKGINLDETLVKEYMDAKTDVARDAAMDKIKQNVADQVPSTWYDKWNAWRYLSMLGNPRTHIRNIIGNAGFVPVRAVKDVLAAGIEKVSGIENSTKAILTRSDKPLVQHALSDYDNVESQIMSLGKFDNLTGDINDRRTIFKTPILEGARKFNTNALNKEDVWFAKPAYAHALAKWYKANKVTAEQLSGGKVEQTTIDTARAYAIREAQRATYRDSNVFSDFVAKLGTKKNTGVDKVTNALFEGVLPFKRTPANILARSVEYSPIGLIKGLSKDLMDVHNGKMEAWQAIDNIAAGLTGTGLVALGTWLASSGIVSGGKSDDDKTNALNTLTGHQNYEINIGGKSFTLDWLAPEALPFFVGVELHNAWTDKSKDGVNLSTSLAKLSNLAEPMLDMSMLQGVDDLFSSIKYSTNNNILGIVATSAVNYLSQALPTLLGQVERITEPQRQTTFVDKSSGIPTSIQYMLGKTANKIPLVDYQQTPYLNGFGKEQSSGNVAERIINNMFNPSYVSTTADNKVTNELRRLNTGNYLKSVPDNPTSNFSYGGTAYNMSPSDYTKFSKTAGQTTYKLMDSLVNSSEYKSMTDEQKANAMSKIQSYANDLAKREYITAQGKIYKSPESSGLETAYEASKKGISYDKYLIYKNYLNKIDSDGGNATSGQEAEAIQETDLATRYKGELWQLQNKTTDADKNPFTGTLSKSGIKSDIIIGVINKVSELDKMTFTTGTSTQQKREKATLLQNYISSLPLKATQKAAIDDMYGIWGMYKVKPYK